MPMIPSWSPTITTMNPLIAGGNKARNLRNKGARPISTKPANIVIPNTAGSPPVPAASTAAPI
jgi:hypothetical protein